MNLLKAIFFLVTWITLKNVCGQNKTPIDISNVTVNGHVINNVKNIRDVILLDSNHNESESFGFNLRLSSQSNWIICTVENTDSLAAQSIIELTNPFLKTVRFYTLDSLTVTDSLITGAQFAFNQRPKNHPNFQYVLVIPAHEKRRCLVNVEVGNVSGDFKLIISNKDKRNDYQLTETKYLSYFFIINISFLFLIGIAILLTRQRYHWYYFIYALFGFFYIYAEIGLGFKNIWPQKPFLQSTCILLIANIYQVFGLLFVNKYFNTKARLPFLYKLLSILVLSGLFYELVVFAYTLFHASLPKWIVQTNTIIFVISGICVFFVAGTSIKFKTLRSDAIWFIIGFTPHAISILQLCLRPFGLFNNTQEAWFRKIAPVYIDTIHPPNFLFWAVLWEVIIVFWLIINRLRLLYEENNRMMAQLSFQREKNLRTLLTGVEKERQRIAQELHDGSGVALSALKMKLNVLKDGQQQNDSNKVSDLMKDVDRIYDDIRNISHNLMPKTLSKLGLYPAIDELVNQFRLAAPQIKFNYFRKVQTNNYSENAKINIFRMIQELLTNVVKHSEAKEVTLQIIKHADALMISIEDDGKGFDSRETKSGIGLTSLESRVQMLNGNLSIDAAPQNGTFISINIPLGALN